LLEYHSPSYDDDDDATVYSTCHQKLTDTHINVKKLQFIHKLTASDTYKIAKITKR